MKISLNSFLGTEPPAEYICSQKYKNVRHDGNSPQKAMDVPDDEFSKFKAAISLFCDIARIGLISLSDEDFTNGKFVVPGR